MDSSSAKNAIANLKFDLVQKGADGGFDILPIERGGANKEDEGDSKTFPLITLPAGIPPVLPTLESEVESLLTSPEQLPMHQFSHCQRFIPRQPQYDRLLHTELCPLLTTIQAERDPRSGKLLKFNEERIPDSTDTPRNSLSLKRAPDISNARCQQDLRGSSGNLPFWPGGMEDEKPEDLDLNELLNGTGQKKKDGDEHSTSTLQLHDVNSYLTTPPGFESGMTFSTQDDDNQLSDTDGATGQNQQPESDTKASELSSSDTTATTATATVVSLADIMAGVDDLDLGDSDDEGEKEAGRDGKDKAGTEEVESIDIANEEGPANLDNLVQVTEKDTTEVKTPSVKASAVKKYEWSVNLDTSQPVHDFYKRIPDMAYKWPFELDIFQKQAILCLENHESVFVAAHTSAGKTVVAEYAIALSMKHMTKTIYTSPIKALSNQKYRDFKQTFGDVGLVTGDVQLNQTASCLIMTTEILRSMLYNGSDVIRDLEWVIFDEVHYINDSERGVVWEEVLIMLPSHVNVILLSATVPNTMEFADWVGRTKKKKIYVVSTPRRPVPLEHFLYTGNSMKTINELFLLMDAKGSFLTSGYTKAIDAKKERASKSSQSFGAKGPRGGNPMQDKNIWLSVIEMLKKKDKLPAVAFTFSRKRIEETASCLTTVDLTSSSEKNEIHIFFQKCIVRLKGSDKNLPQVVQLKELLKRGLGIHHSGVLPILKEMVEMLFQKGLVKILFATETFAMGVNMPARTVVFDNIRKHDGLNFRNLLAGEYIQMAGRAGRRGLDTTGTVILLCKGDVPDMSELHKMMLGKATCLESQFRLTYTMILNLMRVEQLRVQDMMKRSFSEFHHQKESVTHRQSLDQLKDRMKSVKNIECYLCALDLEKYYEDCQEIHSLRSFLQSMTLTHPLAVKALTSGRVVTVQKDASRGQNVLGVVLTSSGTQNKKFTLLFLEERNSRQPSAGLERTDDATSKKEETTTGIQPVLPTSLFLPEGQIWHRIEEIDGQEILCITTKTIKVDSEGIVQDCKRRQIHRFKDDPPDHCVTTAAQSLARLTEANPGGIPGLHPINDLKLRDLELVEQCRALQFLEEGVSNFNCTRCPDFQKHFSEHNFNMGLRDEFKRLQFLLSEESLTLLPEYTQRAEVLKRLHYLDANGTVQLKGRVACEMSNHELMITEIIFENLLTDLPAEEIAAVMSCFVFESRRCSEPELTESLKESRKKILLMAERIGRVQKEVGMLMPVEDYKEQFQFGLMEVVFEWARGMPFSEITTLTDVQEGIIVRTIQRLHELLKDVRNAARLVGDRTLAEKMEESMTLIKRDIVFAASLYTQ